MARRKYSDEYKREAVAICRRDAAAGSGRPGYHPNMLSRWRKAVEKHGDEAFRGQGHARGEGEIDLSLANVTKTNEMCDSQTFLSDADHIPWIANWVNCPRIQPPTRGSIPGNEPSATAFDGPPTPRFLIESVLAAAERAPAVKQSLFKERRTMANWIISCHGYSETKSGKKIALTTRQQYENASIPAGVELVTYTQQGDTLSMAQGWTLWEQLTGSKESEAYASKRKSKNGPKSIINYGLSGPHDASDYKAWLTRAGGKTVSACGLFEVGKPKAFKEFQIGMTVMTLQDALNNAASKNVKRVYYLACQELG